MTAGPVDCIWTRLSDVDHRLAHIEAVGLRTRYMEAGGGGPPIVLLHGTGGHLEVFHRNIGFLSTVRRTVALDLAGHGGTDKPAGFSYTWPGIADHLLATMDALEIDEAFFVGEGLGAQVAQWLAVRHADRARGAVLCGALILPVDHVPSSADREGMERFQDLTRRALEYPTEALMSERMGWLTKDGEVHPELLSQRVEIWRDESFRQSHRALLASYVDPHVRSACAISTEELGATTTPVLVLWSTANPLMGLPVAERLVEALPNGELVVFEHSGMWPQYEEPERFNAEISRFVDRH